MLTAPLIALTLLGADDSKRLAVVVAAVDVASPTTSDVEASVYSIAEKYVGLEVVDSEELFVQGVERSPLACGGNMTCIGTRLAEARVDLGLVVILTPGSDGARFSARLLEASTGKIVGRGKTNVAKPSDMDSVLGTLLRAIGLPQAARLVVSSKPPNAVVRVQKNGEELATGSGPHLLPEGQYDLFFSLAGYNDISRPVDAVAGETTEVTQILEPAPEPGILESPWFWGAVGIGVVGGVTAAILIATSQGSCVCVGPAGVPCPPC